MLRYVIDEYLSKSFDYFIKDKKKKKKKATKSLELTNRQNQTDNNKIKSAGKLFTFGRVFVRPNSIELVRKETSQYGGNLRPLTTQDSLFEELDWFKSFRKGL